MWTKTELTFMHKTNKPNIFGIKKMEVYKLLPEIETVLKPLVQPNPNPRRGLTSRQWVMSDLAKAVGTNADDLVPLFQDLNQYGRFVIIHSDVVVEADKDLYDYFRMGGIRPNHRLFKILEGLTNG